MVFQRRQKMNVPVHILIFYIVSLVRVVESQGGNTNRQPCLLCGDAVLRIWSLMSRRGDRYLRITDNNSGINNHKIVDCAGGLQSDNHTSLFEIEDIPHFNETRIRLVVMQNNQRYHLYAPSSNGDLLAMPASDGAMVTDDRNTWAPERLDNEHDLFIVFQSVKFRNYYLSCDGSGKVRLQQIINQAYREPNQLFITIDPGMAIKGVTFGASSGSITGKREIATDHEADAVSESYRVNIPQDDGLAFWQGHNTKAPKISKQLSRSSSRYWLKKKFKPEPTPKPAPKRSTYASIVRNFELPPSITFVLCFWIKTQSANAQLISVIEKTTEPRNFWPRYFNNHNYYYYWPKRVNKENNIINVSIFRKMLQLHIGYRRLERTFPDCAVTDGKFHQVCISLNHEYLLELYQDGKVLRKERLPNLANDFKSKGNSKKRRGTFILGQTREMKGKQFVGSLFQVNLWEQYPSFRIVRIATNCGCGGGTLVRWSDLLNGTMTNVNFDTTSQCPQLEGYNYDALTQNRLV